MGNTPTFARGNPFTPFANTIFLHLQLFTLIDKLKTTSRYICGTVNSFTMCRLIIDMLTMSSNLITSMHPAFKAVLGLVVYLFGGILLTYAVRSANYWLGFRKGLRLSTASEYCKNLRFQASYNIHLLTFTEELEHCWCLGEQDGVQSRPLFLYSLERMQYHLQFLLTILLTGLLVLLVRHRSDQMTAPNTSEARSGIDPAMRSTSVKPVSVNVFGLGHGNSWFGYLKELLELFDRPSRKDVEAIITKLAAEKDRVHMENLAEARKSSKITLEAREYEYRLLGSSRDAEMKVIIDGLEKEVEEQRQATLNAKMKAEKVSRPTSRIPNGLACKDCEFHRQKLQEYEARRNQTTGEVKEHDQEEPKQAPSQRTEIETSEIKITKQPSPEEQALRQRMQKLKEQIKNATPSTDFQPKADDKVSEELLEKQHSRNAHLVAEVLKLEGKINAMETATTQADTYKAMLTYKANFAAQAAVLQRREQEIATLNEQLQQKERDLHAKGAEMTQAALVHLATVQGNLFYQAELAKANRYCTELSDNHERVKVEHAGLQKKYAELEKNCEELDEKYTTKEAEYQCLDGENEREKENAKDNVRKLERSHKAQIDQLDRVSQEKLDRLTQRNRAQAAQIDELDRRHAEQVAQFNELERTRQAQLQGLAERHDTFLEGLREEHNAQMDELRKDYAELAATFEELHAEHTDVKTKSQKNVELLGRFVNEKDDLERQLQQERDTNRVLQKRIGHLRNDTGDRMDETGDDTNAQRAAEAELLRKTQDLQIRTSEREARLLERDRPGKTPVPLPQPRMMQPPHALNIPSTSAASTIPTVASNATISGKGMGLGFAHLDEARVRKEVNTYVKDALESVTRWSRACFAGSVGAEKVGKNFGTMLANWEYLQEDMIRDEKLLRAVKSVVGLESKWTTAPTLLEVMSGKEPARERMVRNAKRLLARIEGTG